MKTNINNYILLIILTIGAILLSMPVCILAGNVPSATDHFIHVTTAAQTISFSASVVTDSGDSENPVAEADITLVDSNPAVTTQSDADGNFVLTPIPANQPFTIKLTNAGYADIYTADFTSSEDITAPLAYHFLPDTQISDWGNTAGKGMIIGQVGQVIDSGNGFQPVSGATVTITNASDGNSNKYTAVYMDEDGNSFNATQTNSDGLFAIFNIDDTAALTLTASKSGYTAVGSTLVTAHADAATEVFLSMKSEIADVEAAFATMVDAYNAENKNDLSAFISENYLDDGQTKADFLADAQSDWAGDFSSVRYSIPSSSINGDIATLDVSWSDGGGDAMIFKKEGGTWKLYGNQFQFEAEAFSGYQANPTPEYWANIRVNDPNDRIASIDVTGSGITNQINLNHDTDGKSWVTWQTAGTSSDVSPHFGGTRPTLPLSYTVTIHFDSGSQETQELSVNAFLDTVSPGNTQPADGLDMTPADAQSLTFSWDNPGSEYTVGISLFDQNNNMIWNKWDIDDNQVTYDGPAIEGGAYHYVLSINDNAGNSSMSSITFYIIIPGDLTGDGHVGVDDAVDALQVLSGMGGAGHVSTAADINGDGKIGIPEFISLMQHIAGLR